MSGQRKPPSGVKPVTRLIEVRLDEASLRGATRDIEHEREAAIYDLLEQNHFALHGAEGGPYTLVLSLVENRLVFDVTDMGSNKPVSFHLSLAPLRRVVKDYFLVCESYYDAIRQAPLSRIEAIDMGRRGLHDEGTHILMQRLDGKIDVNFETARRLFTLICVLHWQG